MSEPRIDLGEALLAPGSVGDVAAARVSARAGGGVLGVWLSDLDDGGPGNCFRNRPIEQISWSIVEGPAAAATEEALASSETPERFEVEVFSAEEARRQLRTGRTDVVVEPQGGGDRHAAALHIPVRSHAVGKRAGAEGGGRPAAARGRAEGRGRRDARGDRRAGRAVHRFSRARAVGHEPDGRRLVGRGVCDGRHARAQAAQAVSRHADEEDRFSAWAS